MPESVGGLAYKGPTSPYFGQISSYSYAVTAFSLYPSLLLRIAMQWNFTKNCTKESILHCWF